MLLRRLYSQTQLKLNPKFELVRDFIADCLYNPEYGYFNKHVQILEPPETIPFTSFRDQKDYYDHLSRSVKMTSTKPSKEPIGHSQNSVYYKTRGSFAPLWQTPSELFRPHYGQAMARFLLSKREDSKEPLIIYEIGPGNGSLAKDILDHLSVLKVANVEYNLIEISDRLRQKQKQLLAPYPNVKFTNWHALDPPKDFIDDRKCFVVAMEAFDNLPHDLIKYRNEDGHLMEAIIGSNEEAEYGTFPGKIWQEFRPITDSLIGEFVHVAESTGWQSPSLKGNSFRRLAERLAPTGTYINPWSCEYIPTGAFLLLKKLSKHLPKHQLLASDFFKLPKAIPGHNGPVVQTRFEGQTVACSTLLLARGLFDIFFPVNFSLLHALRNQIHSNAKGKDESFITSHEQFLKQNSSNEALKATTTRSGYNPMLQDFQNVHFYFSG